jgi:hypothetical protein
MIRPSIAGLLVASLIAGCAVEPVPTGGSYCRVGTQLRCPALEGSGDCQPCPRVTTAPTATTAAAATPAFLTGNAGFSPPLSAFRDTGELEQADEDL